MLMVKYLQNQYSSPLDIPGVNDLPSANKQAFVENMNMAWGKNSDGTDLEAGAPAADSSRTPGAMKGKESAKKVATPNVDSAPKANVQAPSSVPKDKPPPSVLKSKPRQSSRQSQKRKYLAEEEEEELVAIKKVPAKPKAKAPASREFKRQTKTTKKKK